MNRKIKHSISINATPASVWRSLTDKEIVKQYMFGTNVASDWEKGSRIEYTGEYQGTVYKDGGEILDIVPEKLLKHTYWSSMSGFDDIPENYVVVTYSIDEVNGETILTVEQEGMPTEQMAENSDKHWPMVLKTIKEILER